MYKRQVRALEYEDTPTRIGSAALGGDNGTTYYYAVTSVDEYGDESVMSTAVSPPAFALSLGGDADGGSGGGGAGCFVSAAQFDVAPYTAWFGLVFGGFICFLIHIMRREDRHTHIERKCSIRGPV